MAKKFLTPLLCFLVIASSSQLSTAAVPGEIYRDSVSIEYRNVTVYAPAVAQTENGYMGVISTITATIQSKGSGRVFVDTLPLTQIDMQGSARLAVKVASSLVRSDPRCDVDPSKYDFFFVVRTDAPIIGGPSAGAIMAAAVVSLLENWKMDERTVMTGMINPDGSIGPVGGIIQKIDAAYSVGAKRFLIPKGQGVYIETITETEVENGWTKTVVRQIPRNVSDYAWSKYGMDVVEVEDINDALLYFTGYDFPINESESRISTEDYIYSMKPLAINLLEKAKESYRNASDAFNTTYIPNRFPYYYREQVEDFLKNARRSLKEAEDWYERELYYTSTSNSFQSLIDSRFVSYACEYFNSDNKDSYVKSLLEEARVFHESKSKVAINAEINGMISLQCVGAAQERASNADSYLNKAALSINSMDYLTALSRIAYAMERCESIEWWIGIASSFNDTGEVNASMIKNLARDYIEDAQQAVIYSRVILQQMGKMSDHVNEAEELLETARGDKEKGYYAAALFESFRSLVKANLALELVDGIDEDKVERARERASSSISESRNIGIEPVLAVSYYEYAQSLFNKSHWDKSLLDTAIVYYKYSDLIAGALGFTGTYIGRSSRYLGIPEIPTLTSYLQYLVVFTVVGVVIGLCIGLLLGGKPSKKGRYVSKYISEQQIPRSIRDYYKKIK